MTNIRARLRVEMLCPIAVEATSDLPTRLRAEVLSRGASPENAEAIVSLLPPALTAAGCFLDRLTNLWKYEFGEPVTVGDTLVWGHLWQPVKSLHDVLVCARLRLTPEELAVYTTRLASNPAKHIDYLSEMFPMLRVDPAVPAKFEVCGRGAGNSTIDWELQPLPERLLLLDVKRRFADFLAQMGAALPTASNPEPDHDHGLMFRSLESKFNAADPDQALQGAFIWTDIKQEKSKIIRAFEALDGNKIHFATFGDSREDVLLLTRRHQDRGFLLKLFRALESERFCFEAM